MKIRIIPPIIALIYLSITYGIDHFLIRIRLVSQPFSYLGIIILIGAMILVIWAVWLFVKRETSFHPHDDPAHLVTSGPYRFTRNPMYLGQLLGLLGLALSLGTLALFFAPIAYYFSIDRSFIRKEEKKLKKIFGKEYLAYQKTVRRWI